MTLAREAEIRALGLLSQPPPDALQHLVAAAVRVTGAESARVNVITGTKQHTLASATGAVESHDIEDSLCANVVRGHEPQRYVPDLSKDAQTASNPYVISGHVTSYAASQLVSRRGVPIGTLCVYSADYREVGPEALEVLSELAAAVMDILESNSARDELHDVVIELADGSRELRRSNEHLAAFAGQVSHDLKGPLSALLMSLQLIDDDVVERELPAPPHLVDLLHRAITASYRMQAMIGSLMDFAALGGVITPAPVDLEVVVKDVLGDLGGQAGDARVEIGNLPTVCGDEVQLRALVQNLVSNAFKYAGTSDDTHILVAGEHLDGRSRISVGDNGPGIPPGERESVFGIMVRGSDARGGDVEGLGIGLATCRRIAQAHGGVIGVAESAEGGAEFWFEVPDRT
jgi:signal transduction histidine kinase